MSRSPRLLALTTALMLPCIARAVVVYGGDGTQNTTPPANGAPWERVGVVNGATGLYLGSFGGSDWVLTANHVGAGSFALGGATYSAVQGSERFLTSPNGARADLLLYQINTSLDWSLLPISSSSLAVGTAVTMVGFGYDREASLSGWDVTGTGGGTTWSGTSPEGADATGYAYAADGSHSLRWGTNVVSGGGVTVNHAGWSTFCGVTTFDAIADDAQGAAGDSGGGVFSQAAGGSWTVAGIMGYIDTFVGQPGRTAVVGNKTYYADLSAYRGQILTAIPEPATVALWSGVGALGLALWWRRRR